MFIFLVSSDSDESDGDKSNGQDDQDSETHAIDTAWMPMIQSPLPTEDLNGLRGQQMLSDNTIHYVQQMMKKVGVCQLSLL